MNILNKTGLLTDEDRKQPLERGCEYFTFTTNIDLSQPVKMVQYGASGKVTLDNYTRDIASFVSWWSHFILKDLNGFSGFSHVKFELVVAVFPSASVTVTGTVKVPATVGVPVISLVAGLKVNPAGRPVAA